MIALSITGSSGRTSLHCMYRAYYEGLRARCRPGQTLEIGGGSGNLKNFHASRGID